MAPVLPSTQIAAGNAMAVNATAATFNMTAAIPLHPKADGYQIMDVVTACVSDTKDPAGQDSHTATTVAGGAADSYVLAYYLDRVSNATETAEPSLQLARRDSPNIAQLAVDTHNRVRAKHGVQPLRWNQDLANYAQTVAAMCRLAHNTAVGAETGGYGQSIASWGTNGVEHRTVEQLVVDGIEVQWYTGEIGKYPGYGHEPGMEHFHDWGHFSQTVWAATSEVGCAMQYCPAATHVFDNPTMSAHLMFCNYRAAGNDRGQYGANVKPPI